MACLLLHIAVMIVHIIFPLFFIRFFSYIDGKCLWILFLVTVSYPIICCAVFCFVFFKDVHNNFSHSPLQWDWHFSLQEGVAIFLFPSKLDCLVTGPGQQNVAEVMPWDSPYTSVSPLACTERAMWGSLRMTAKTPQPAASTDYQTPEWGHLGHSSSSNPPAEQRHMSESRWHKPEKPPRQPTELWEIVNSCYFKPLHFGGAF